MSREVAHIPAEMEGIFVERPNRFLGRVQLEGEGKAVPVHIHDPGRLREILFPGNRVLLHRVSGTRRKTAWDLVAGQCNGHWVLVHSSHHRAIAETILSHPLVSKVKTITGRSSGSYKFIEAEVTVLTNELEKAHNIVHEVEAKVKREHPFIEKIIIHFEPEEKEKLLVAVPVEGDKVCGRFAECPEILILEVKKGNLREVKRIKNPAVKLKFGKCIELVELLAKEGVNCIAINNLPLGKGVIYALSAYNIGMKLITKEKLEDFLKELSREPYCEPPLAVWSSYTCDIIHGGKVEGKRADREG